MQEARNEYEKIQVFKNKISVVIAPKKVETKEPKNDLTKNQIQKLKNRIAEIEILIPKLEDELTRTSAKLSTSEFVSDHKKLTELSSKIHDMELNIQKLYLEWDASLKMF